MRLTSADQMPDDSGNFTGSVYLPNIYQLAFQCDAVVPAHIADKKATAYADRTGKSFYVPGLGHYPKPEPEPDAIKKATPRP